VSPKWVELVELFIIPSEKVAGAEIPKDPEQLSPFTPKVIVVDPDEAALAGFVIIKGESNKRAM
jgi:hypothetical protein